MIVDTGGLKYQNSHSCDLCPNALCNPLSKRIKAGAEIQQRGTESTFLPYDLYKHSCWVLCTLCVVISHMNHEGMMVLHLGKGLPAIKPPSTCSPLPHASSASSLYRENQKLGDSRRKEYKYIWGRRGWRVSRNGSKTPR